jgi:hypothetical protein
MFCVCGVDAHISSKGKKMPYELSELLIYVIAVTPLLALIGAAWRT